MFGIEALAAPQVEQAGLEPPLLVGQRAAAGRQLEVLQAELVDRRGALIDQLADRRATRRPRRSWAPSGSGWNRHSSRCRRSSASRAPGSAATGPLQDDDDVGRALGHPAAGIEDRAEQQQLRAGEAVADLDRARAEMSGTSTGLAGADQQRRDSASEQQERTPRFTDIRSRRFRRAARRGRAPCAARRAG